MLFSLYLIFLISFFLHLSSRIQALGHIRFDFLLGSFLIVAAAVSGKLLKADLWKEEIPRSLLIFFFFVLLSIPLVTWTGSVVRYNLATYLKATFFFTLSLVLIDTEKKLKIFVTIFLGCQLIRILEPAYLHITLGYWGDKAYSHIGGGNWLMRLEGAPHDVVNSNQLAWVANNTIPFLFYLVWEKKGLILKLTSGLIFCIILYVLLLTGSRSGLISLIVIIGGIISISGKKNKTAWVGAAILVVALVFGLTHLTPQYKERYRSIYDKSAVGADTAEGRIRGIKRALRSVLDAPIFGHGLGTSAEVNVNVVGGRHQLTHCLYVETLQEVGIAGFVLFMAYIKSIIKILISIRKKLPNFEQDPFMFQLTNALLVWVIMDLIYSLSCFGLSSWEWYLFGGLTAAAYRILNQRQAQATISQ